MAFGEKEGAIGYLVGPPHSGLAFMFIMMNAARLSVGVQGVAQSERALQQALDWARNRNAGASRGRAGAVAIIEHPDVKRMLLSMKARTEAMRALCAFRRAGTGPGVIAMPTKPCAPRRWRAPSC